MTITRIIFEHGIEVGQGRNCAKQLTSGFTFVELFAEIWERFKVRPVLMTETISSFANTIRERHGLLTLDGKDRLNLRISSLEVPKGLPEATYISLLWPTINVQYMAESLIYHCRELALLYSDICARGSTIRQVMNIEENTFNLQGLPEAYYEIESLITQARRTYDALRYILWKVFGPGGRDTPNNFPRTLVACHKLPMALRQSLENSWSSYGKRLTEYRDCIQHYVPVTSSLQDVLFRRVDEDIWSVRMLLPDNPDAKSQRDFTFANNVDALTYGWQLANEVITRAAQVFAAIPVETPPAPT